MNANRREHGSEYRYTPNRGAVARVARAPRFEPIAIVGMRGRFPGANDLDTYWKNLANGVESITTLSQEDMRAAGIPDAVSRLPGYVNAAPLLDNVDQFDAEFFGFSARDAALTDPQHRVFLETCWEALEDAGYDPGTFRGLIGLFGGCELSSYLYHLHQNADSLQYIDGMQLMVTNDKDHLCTQASYRLNLRGPSVVVQTTCSTSLVAVSLACESLQARRCDMALAGGVTVRIPQRGGYFYTAGSILSPDGHCRPFDANAQGTIVGSGVGLVVLRRLHDALESGDNIRAVLLGIGLNNDGNDKVGYTAPSFKGQAAAIRAALAAANIPVETIGYVEAHGTGTILGDPIEIAALNEVFRSATGKRGYCGIGSAKSNFGHLSCAAGVAGLIKTVLALEHGEIPPTVHYRSPNPAIDLVSSPFYVATRLEPWPRTAAPRRAAVSSFGVGGTNAHVVLEEARNKAASNGCRSHQLIVLSARTDKALDASASQLAAHLRAHPELELADVAFTLQSGRRAFSHRRAITVPSTDREGLIARLGEPAQMAEIASGTEPSVVFLFPGQGAQYPSMASGLYRTEPVVRRAIDQCAEALIPELKVDLRKVLFPSQKRRAMAADQLRDTQWAQPALFTVAYAIAQLWRSWGIRPAAMIGHSVGEYVAATLSGVLTLEDALKLIATRGRLIAQLPRGSMLGVMASRDDIERFVGGGDIALAAVNGPNYFVLSGPDAGIDAVEKTLTGAGVPTRRLHTSHAFHSSMMDPILEEFEAVVAGASLAAPSIPFVATLTGEWADAAVTHPSYWRTQLRSTVRFADAVRTVAGGNHKGVGKVLAVIEVGPGNTLTTFASGVLPRNDPLRPLVGSLPGPHDRRSDAEVMLGSLGQLWAAGVDIDWEAFRRRERRVRVSLPTYPFERRSYWVGSRAGATPKRSRHEVRDTSDWFYRPVWREIAAVDADLRALSGRRILVLDDGEGLGASLVDRLRQLGADAVTALRGAEFARVADDRYVINPSLPEQFSSLVRSVCASANRLAGLIDCWSATAVGHIDLDTAGIQTLLAPMRLAHALESQQTVRPLQVLLVARGVSRVTDNDVVDPPRALGLGVAKVIPQEHPGLHIAHVDVDHHVKVPDLLLAELAGGAPEPAVALRGGLRFAEAYEPIALAKAEPPIDLPGRPVVMVTGGLGHMGLSLSEALFTTLGARLVLLGRTNVPAPDSWKERSEDESTTPEQRALLTRLVRLREQRDEVMVLYADLNDATQVKTAVDAAIDRFGQIDLLIHGAARIDAAAFASVAETDVKVMEAQFSPKLRGVYHLLEAFRGREPRRWVLHSSISAVLGGLGLGAYSAANTVLDAFAAAGGDRWLSIGWDLWDNAAEAKIAGMPIAIHPPEGQQAFLRLLGANLGPRVLVVAGNFVDRLKAWVRTADRSTKKADAERHPRPNLSTAFVEPRTDTERKLAEIWSAQLGIEPIGVHDRFFDLGGHSLLAVQVASEIRDRFQIEMPVLRLFQAPSIGELATLIEKIQSGSEAVAPAGLPTLPTEAPEPSRLEGEAPGVAAKASYREFYDDVTRRLAASGVAEASFFLNYGYVSLDTSDEARLEVPEGTFNPSSIRLAFELIDGVELAQRRVLDVGCGRGGTVALLAEHLNAQPTGIDLSPEAIAFCRRTHQHPNVAFEVGDAENLPFEKGIFDVVTNMESSHTYPNLRAFFAEVARVLKPGGLFLYTDLLPVARWLEVRALLEPLELSIFADRHITPNVLASCDEVAATRAQAFGGGSAAIDNFLAVPGSMVYEQMRSGAWEYRIVRAQRK